MTPSPLDSLRVRAIAFAVLGVLACGASQAAAVTAVQELAREQQQPLLDTLRELVPIESGSGDSEGLEKVAALMPGRLRALGGRVDGLPPREVYRMEDTPPKTGAMVQAQWT